MKALRNLRVGVRLGVAFGLVGLLLAGTVGIGLYGQLAQNNATGRLNVANEVRRDALIAKFRSADFIAWQTGYAFDIVRGVPGAADDGTGARLRFLSAADSFRRDLERVRQHRLAKAEEVAADAALAAFGQFMTVDVQIIRYYRYGSEIGLAEAGKLTSGESQQWLQRIVQATDALVAAAEQRAQAAKADFATTADVIRVEMLVGGSISLLLAALLSIIVTRTITRPLSVAVRALRAVAAKDLTARVGIDSRDELGDMARAVDGTLATLRESFGTIAASSATLNNAVAQLNESAGQIDSAAEETSVQSDRVATASGEVALSVQTVAAATEEMNAAISGISGSASEAASVASSGVRSAKQASRTVTRLGESSREIGSMVKLINSIAEQTNL
ncbi:MAG TPA: methyl-accepting chemotaxis protein, partial [Actinoplanes sp.]|nr:methyl-accepting chemotaxis protein [Actinoplanes sp.]